jgi:hypothetical protein
MVSPSAMDATVLLMAVARVMFLVVASLLAVYPRKRLPGWTGPAALAVAALVIRVAPLGAARSAGHNLANPIAFLLLAVPLAVLLDQSGFFAALAGMIGATNHLLLGLWMLAALVTIVFDLDAAVVLLTPLFVRIAERRGRDPVAFGFISSPVDRSEFRNGRLSLLPWWRSPCVNARCHGATCPCRRQSSPSASAAWPRRRRVTCRWSNSCRSEAFRATWPRSA